MKKVSSMPNFWEN